jgi:hypothetical protein
MKPIINEVGNKYSKLTVLAFSHMNTNGKACFVCKCDCGKETIVSGSLLRNGSTRSCGCLVIEMTKKASLRHGACVNGESTKEYHIWMGMKDRCRNPHNKAYRFYGAKGIIVCDRWAEFSNFLSDMGKRPSNKHSIDRIDSTGNYEPSNCRWATMKEQQNNRIDNRIIEFDGKSMTVARWANHLGIPPYILGNRLSRRWSEERALTQPVRDRVKSPRVQEMD